MFAACRGCADPRHRGLCCTGPARCDGTVAREYADPRIPDPDNESDLEIAELPGVSKHRAHQLADELGFPAPVERAGPGRLWSKREVAAWAKT